MEWVLGHNKNRLLKDYSYCVGGKRVLLKGKENVDYKGDKRGS